LRILLTTFEGGGHVPPALLLARRLIELGHQVLFVSDTANRAAADAASLPFAHWHTAPNREVAGAADDPLQDWRLRWPPAIVESLCDAVITDPAARYALDTLQFIERFQPDVIVTNELLFGVMIAAERTSTPLALFSANVWCFPTRNDVPPFGPGFPPANGRFTAGREKTARGWIARLYDVGLPTLNAARAIVGLTALAHTLDQLQVSRLNVLATSRAFDYDCPAPAEPFRYAGPLIDMPIWAAHVPPPRLPDDRPLVLVSFSTAFQNDLADVARCILAIERLPVRGLVTAGPAIDLERLPHAPNVTVVRTASHDAVLPHCAAVVCHGGHGTLLRALAHGVPVVCVPAGRDQPENAARLAWHRAGLRLGTHASARRIRSGIAQVLRESSFRDSARRLATRIRAEMDGGLGAAEAIASLAQRRRTETVVSPSFNWKLAADHRGGPNKPRASFENP
jgi:MGT family glycosyltransferase